MSHLEEVDLHGAVGEVQDDGALGPEPEREVRQPRQLVSVPPRHVGSGLQQVLAHVVTEIFQQRYLEGKEDAYVRIHTMTWIKVCDIDHIHTAAILLSYHAQGCNGKERNQS